MKKAGEKLYCPICKIRFDKHSSKGLEKCNLIANLIKLDPERKFTVTFEKPKKR